MAEPQKASISDALDQKEKRLRDMMRDLGRVLVAYSGGVDSAYLAYIANSELGRDAVCVTGVSPSVSRVQRREAAEHANRFSLNHVEIDTEELADPNYSANPSDRCYFCKSELYGKLREFASEHSIGQIVDGSNADDVGDHRPGMSAATERGVRSPLKELDLTKAEIRELSRRAGIEGWEKPASPCLSSRIAYGVPVTIERLGKIERGEEFLRNAGFREFRLRVHGDLARIEIATAELARALEPEFARLAADEFERLGFKFVTLDLRGFRSGAMNAVLSGVTRPKALE